MHHKVKALPAVSTKAGQWIREKGRGRNKSGDPHKKITAFYDIEKQTPQLKNKPLPLKPLTLALKPLTLTFLGTKRSPALSRKRRNSPSGAAFGEAGSGAVRGIPRPCL